jgi:DNA-binding CsgD family transcriptional regulator
VIAESLLERESAMVALGARLSEASRGGRLILVTGEAGIGKTSLLKRFRIEHPEVHVWWGGCDALSTPRPLGPLRDIAAEIGGELADALTPERPRYMAFDVLAGLLRRPARPTALVLEDVHWADDATLDLLVFLARRLSTFRAVIVVTFRAPDPGQARVQAALGEVGTAEGLSRIDLAPLSASAVAVMAGDAMDAAGLHRVTGGNPFYITEALASRGGVPRTVRDAVTSRVSRLGPHSRQLVDALSVIPGPAEMWLLTSMVDVGDDHLDSVVASGVIQFQAGLVQFRHELARLAVEQALPPARRRALHAQALACLSDHGADATRLAHHAGEAGDGEALMRWAPLAAAEATKVGANREAAQLLRRAAPEVHRLGLRDRAAFYVRLAHAEGLIDVRASKEAWTAALRAYEELGDEVRAGEVVARLGRAHGSLGDEGKARHLAGVAVSRLELTGPSAELVYALVARAHGLMLERRNDEAAVEGWRAIQLSKGLDGQPHLAYALITTGVAQLMTDDEPFEEGLSLLREGITVAGDGGDLNTAGLGWSQIGSGAGELRRYAIALPALEEGSRFAESHQLDVQASYLHAWRARCYCDVGRWEEAVATAESVLRMSQSTASARMVALNALGRVRARRGQSGVWEALDEARDLAVSIGHLQRLWPVAASRAEAGWLDGDIERHLPMLTETLRQAHAHEHRWAIGELTFWLWRGGHPSDPARAAMPFALHIQGEFQLASREWQRLGCPYEAATALADTEADSAAWREAHDIFRDLGASPALAGINRQLRAHGFRTTRGPNAATVANPAGLTQRELEVLDLVTAGMTNPQIARALSISVKTAGHHVSAVLAKLGVSRRSQAVAKAVALDIGSAKR